MLLSSDDRARLRCDLAALLGRPVRTSDVEATLELLADGRDPNVARFASGCLAELLAASDPWRASLHARRVLAAQADDARAWGALALAQERLGNLRYARQAFHRAAELAPDDPRYLFHLAHLWDLASPRSAVLSVLPAPEALESWLRRSSAGETADIRGVPSPEKLFDHARALRRAGLSEAASRAEAVAAEKGREPARAEQGTLEGGDKSSQTGLIKGTAESSRGRTVLRGATTSKEVGTWTEVMFANLPFSPRQRRAARRLAADGRAALRAAGLRRGADEDKALAAAAAWAIAAIDELPLGCAEVAASFRLSTERVRRTYERLRGLLGLTAKDPRYGHPRRALRT